MLDRVGHRPAAATLVLTCSMSRRLARHLVLRYVKARFGGSEISKQLHSTLARDALELLGGQLINRVKDCAGEDCSRLYL